MEHRREFKEEEATVPLLEQQVPSAHEEEEGEAEESPQVHKSFFSDPSPLTRDYWIQGRGRGREISALLGAMRPLLGKLDMLLLAPPQGCSNSKRVKDGMRLLKDDVEKMSSCLDQLSELEDPPPRAKCWMNEARDLSYDMEDYMDSLIFVRPQDPSLLPNNIKTTRSRLKFRPHLKLFGHTKTPKTESVIIAETLSEFNVYVQEAIERHKRYGLHSCSTLRRRFVSLGPMLLPMQYEDIVIDGRMNGFIKSLAEDGDQQLKALSVLGPACIGKTTLAKVLYNRLGKQYHCRAFIRVSKKPDMKSILRDMLSQLQRQHPPQHYMEIDLLHNINQYLQDKRYLIIIDDIWATSVWDTINHAFPKGSQGSRIVTTTQIEDVAIACCCYQSDHVFEMKPLDDDQSRKLFFNIIFGAESDCPEELKEVSNKILEICDGLPLATISIASLVASQPVMSIDLLTYIHQSLCSCFSANSTSEITRQVLSLSYNNLPHYLKTCLLYLSMYQEGYTFCKDDLLKQWVAEGLIDTTEGQDIKKVAESYLDQLIGRRFIQPICINYNNEVLSCAVHDVVYDLIAHKSAEENFIVAMDYSCRKNVALYQKARRLSLLFGDAKYAQIPSNIRKSQVRSLRFFGLLECMPCIGEFKLLRVLNLQLSGHRHGDQDPAIDLTGISELFHLRYLKVVCDVCIKLPNRMRGLQCLETLDVMDTTRGTHVPWDIIYLPHLLHLSLPVDTNLLDHLHAEPHLVCPHLQCLSVSFVSLGMLNHLQDLYIPTPPSSDHVERSMEALGSLIGGHGKLKTMVVAHGSSVRYGGISKATIYWNNMAPPPCLQRFECLPHSGIIFYRIPRWMEQLGNLCILKIAVSELMIYDVSILTGLPVLTALSLYVEKVPYHKIIVDKAGFFVLKYFKLRFTSGIAWLKFEADAMPNLLKLKLVFNAIPQMDQYEHGIISIEHMPGLREIYVKFGGAAADLKYVTRIGVVSNHPSNPIIDVQLVDSGSHGDESTKQKQPDEILEEKPDEYDKALEIPDDKRISSRLPESSSCLHLPDDRINLMLSMSQKVAITSMSAKARCSDDLQMAYYNNSVPLAANGQFYMMQNHQDVHYTSSHSISPISGSPWSQHDSHLDHTYNSPPTASCVTEIPDLQSKLKELENAILGPELEIASDSPESLLQANNPLKQDDWRQLLGTNKGDLKQVIIACGRAVAENDTFATELLISELGQLVSVSGDPMQRLGAYMLEGLVARLSSSGSKLYKSLKCKEPTNSELMSYMHLLYEICPFYKFGYMSANGAIAEAIKGENFIHIIDFQIAQGSQWVTMIQALAVRPGGPPLLRITGIDDSNSAYARGGGLDMVATRLHNISASFGLPFEFNIVHAASHEVYLQHLDIRPGEVIVVNFAYQLHHTPDESVSVENHRDRILRMIKSLSPRVVTLVEQESNTNTAPFFPRYLETLDYYMTMFESIDVALPRNDKRRISIEQHCVARGIVNLIACEGAERTERQEVFGKWKARFAMARFRPYPLSSVVKNTIKTLLNSYSSDYRLEERDGVLYLGWKNRVLVVSSAWC